MNLVDIWTDQSEELVLFMRLSWNSGFLNFVALSCLKGVLIIYIVKTELFIMCHCCSLLEEGKKIEGKPLSLMDVTHRSCISHFCILVTRILLYSCQIQRRPELDQYCVAMCSFVIVIQRFYYLKKLLPCTQVSIYVSVNDFPKNLLVTECSSSFKFLARHCTLQPIKIWFFFSW